ncbi:MAG: succinate dehydrogenase iron-sulfur subunit [Thaumarchaeota archaeon]|nr:succinate dehydrogenase iron-sulfur subunit [Candidatus Calditenuaceae archaeon]MDW8187130.1 succinate dehydrogenase iron-sulfur subunit [Nitrososphaerota archaeon]
MKTVRFSVYRFDPSSDKKERYATYEVPYKTGMTVLDGLLYIKERLDHTLAIRYSCRMGICGSCGMTVNGLPRLACYTQVKEVGWSLKVEPLRNHPHVRDLVTNFDEFFKKHKSVKPWLVRTDSREQESPTSQYLQSDAELEKYIQFSYCISCGLCYSACPVVSSLPEFPGPQALALLYRYLADSRDQSRSERLKIVDEAVGIWRCHFAGSCSQVCPKGVDPALAIQLLRREMMRG